MDGEPVTDIPVVPGLYMSKPNPVHFLMSVCSKQISL